MPFIFLNCCRGSAKQRYVETANKLVQTTESQGGARADVKPIIGLELSLQPAQHVVHVSEKAAVAKLEESLGVIPNPLNVVQDQTMEYRDYADQVRYGRHAIADNLWTHARQAKPIDMVGEATSTLASLRHHMTVHLPTICTKARKCALQNQWDNALNVVGIVLGHQGDIQLLLDVCTTPNYDDIRVLSTNGTTAYIIENHNAMIHMLIYSDTGVLPLYNTIDLPPHIRSAFQSSKLK